MNPFVLSAPYEQLVIGSSPYLYYALNETTGTVATDLSGNGRHGTYNGAPALASRTLGKWLTADFDGTNDFVSTPAFNTTGWPGISVECWYLLDTQLSGTGLISETYTGSGDRITLEIGGSINAATGGILMVARYNGSAWHQAASTTTSALNTRYHIVGTMDATTLIGELWLNGTKIATGSLNSWMPDAEAWTIGRRHDASGTPYVNGAIAHSAIYNRVVTPAEIAARYASGVS